MAPRSMIEWYRRFGGTSLLCRHVWNRLLLPVIYPKMYSLTQPFIKQLLLNDISNHISQLRVSPVLSFNNNCLMESCVRLIFCIYIYIYYCSFNTTGLSHLKIKKKNFENCCYLPHTQAHLSPAHYKYGRKWSRARLKRDGTRAETRFSLSAKRTSPFKLADGGQFSRLLAAEVCASAVVILDTPCSEVEYKTTGYPFH